MDNFGFNEFSKISSNIICVIDKEGNLHSKNPVFEQKFCQNDSQKCSKRYTDFLHQDDLRLYHSAINLLNKKNHNTVYETRLLTDKESSLLISWSASLDVSTGYIYQIGHDITQSKHDNSQFAQVYQTLMNHSIIAMTDIKGNILEVNEKFCNISGYTQDELIGQNHRILNSGAHPKQFFVDMWKNISSGKTWIDIIQNKRKNGEFYFVYSIIAPLFDHQGKIENYLSIRFDMTKHVEIQNELTKTAHILKNTSSIAHIGGWELVIETGELNWTDETFKILEVEKKKDQKPILTEGLGLFVPEHKAIIENAVHRAITYGEPYSLEVQALTAKGNKLWVYTNGRANYEDGKVATLSGTIQNIHHRKIIELKYEQERIKALQNAKLASLGELSAGVSHEIKNPLAIILGNLLHLKKFKDDAEKFDRKIELIKKSCERINQIATNLVKFSRGSSTVDLAPVPLKKLLEECLSLAELKAKSTGAKISLECETSSEILCNEIQIEQVIINLINNAVDATKDLEQKWIKITAHEVADMISIKIIDSGAGISLEMAKHLFEPFYSTKPVGEGTGLGLSISKGILEEHNAKISIDHKNANTCFVIALPKYIR